VYGNTITMTCGTDVVNGSYSIKHQGSGEWYVFNNTVDPSSGKGSPHILQNYRSFYDFANACDGTDAEDGNRTPIGTYRGYPCNRQPGRDVSGTLKPHYYWNNRWDDNTQISLSVSCPDQGTMTVYCSEHIQANRDYYQGGITAQTSTSSPFNGTSGTGFGTLANRPTTCTPTPLAADAGNGGVGYFATDDGAQGTLYRCSATDTWTVAYTPYTYPHPLAATGSSAPTVTTSAASSITATTATGNGDVTSDGGDTITERGVCWSTSSNPTTAGTCATSAGTTGAFSASMTSLTSSTLYHYRAYATNSVGTSYGADTTFTTSASGSTPTAAMGGTASRGGLSSLK
jgi:hypothetical protein